MVGNLIKTVLSNLGILLLAAAVIVAVMKARRGGRFGEILWAELVFYGVGLSMLWSGLFHAAFPDMVAPTIGWQPSPFEWEVAWASFGIAALAILSRWRGYEFRLAATIAFCLFSLGAAIQHIHQILCCRNYAPGNAGAILYVGDLGLPVALIVLAFIESRAMRPRSR